MSFKNLMIAGGIAKAYNEEVAEKKAQVAEINAVKREYLFKTGMSNIQARRDALKASRQRISEAKKFGFSTKSARALEMSGQLEFEVEKVATLAKNGKLSDKYVETLSAFLEDKVDGDEALAAAVAKGLQGDSFKTEEEMSLGLINSIGDLNELQEQFLKTTEPSGRMGLPAFQYSSTKGPRIELSDRKSIQTQLASALSTMYDASFTTNANGDVMFSQDTSPDVQVLFNNLTEKTVNLAEDPSNSFSPVSALNTVITSIENSSSVPATTVLEKIDEAITTPSFNWEPFKVTTTPTTGPTGNPTDDI
ncbi:hypothetical protein CRP13_gp36 [Roseobacter phage CRP-13]|nr:hypothetical protein CRP13_gp36 [Roseobacter phage CRP-13]